MLRRIVFILSWVLVAFSAEVRADTVVTSMEESIELISPARCTVSAGRLTACNIPTRVLMTSIMDTAVPLRTELRTIVSGKCSTQLPLEVKVQAANAPAAVVPYLRAVEVMLRTQDRAPIPEFTLSDNSSWTRHAALDESCRISLNARWNEVDVASAAEAHDLLDQMTQELVSAKARRDRMHELMLYQAAFQLMRGLTEHFQEELSNETMQELRDAALLSAPALEQMILSCDQLPIEERLNLMRLHLSLGVLGHPEDWTQADGSVMTLEDHLGPQASAIIATLNQIIARQGSGQQPTYESEYQAAELAVQRLEGKLALAKAQLSPWTEP
jgi:hypothetical protein